MLWASSGPYSWISKERADAPRTYVWVPPADMARELRKGQPLMVQRKGKKGKPGDDGAGVGGAEGKGGKQQGGQSSPSDAYWWTALQPEHAEKD